MPEENKGIAVPPIAKDKGITGSIVVRAAIGAAILVFLFFYGALLYELVWAAFFQNEGSFQSFLPILMNVVGFIIGTEIFLILTRYGISKYLENRGKKKEIKLILTLYTYLVWALVAIFLISTIFKDVGALLTSLGLIGFGITFALQNPILNFVGWLTIVIIKPFNIGDRIEVQGLRGDVVAVHTMYTIIQGTRTSSHEKTENAITIPNSLVLTNPVVNYTRIRGTNYIDEVIISITYESNWRKAMVILENVTLATIKKYLKVTNFATPAERKSWQEAMKLMREASKKLKQGFVKQSVKENLDIMKSAEGSPELEIPKPNIKMELGASSIDLAVLYTTDISAVRATRHDIVKSFMDEIEKRNDIEIAYPHMQLLFSEDEKKKVKKGMQEKLFKAEDLAPPQI
ncbi:MAG: mechanosensitive ion channel family protein [archaeon]|nr:mechanosensitive ion channel family protein [archaeon]